VVAALGTLPVRALVTLGDVISPSEIAPPPNVRVVRSAAHGPLLPRARAVVTHGGHGTVMKALSHGVPLLCLPFGRDQKDVAARVVSAGVGLSLSPGAPVAKLREALRRVLEDPGFRDRARRLGEHIRAELEADAAVCELETLVARRAAKAAA